MRDNAQQDVAVPVFWLRHGTGVPILIMHGGMGLDHSYLRAALDPLADRAQLIYYDHRGSGRSPVPESWDQITHETWVEDADALRRALGHERLIIFGHSYGGIIAQEYALRYPDRVAGLILCSTFAKADFQESILAAVSARGTKEQMAMLVELFSEPAVSDDTFGRLITSLLPLYFMRPSAQYLGHFSELIPRAAAFNHSNRNCLPQFSSLDSLHRIVAPTLILNGTDDFSAPVEATAIRLHRGIRDSSLVLFDRSGHFPFIEESEKFLAVVSEWLTSVEPALGAREHHSS